jgi:RHS repeat-associated protein
MVGKVSLGLVVSAVLLGAMLPASPAAAATPTPGSSSTSTPTPTPAATPAPTSTMNATPGKKATPDAQPAAPKGAVKVSSSGNSTTYRLPDGSFQTKILAAPVPKKKGASPDTIGGNIQSGTGGSECQLTSGTGANTVACASTLTGGPNVEVGFDGTTAYRALMYANPMSGIPAGSVINYVGVSMLPVAQTPLPTIQAYRVTKSWNQASWNDSDTGVAWTTPGGDYDTTTSTYTAPGYTATEGGFNITQLAMGWINGTVANDGIILKEVSETGTAVQTYHQPYLLVDWEARVGDLSYADMQKRQLSDQVSLSVNPTNGNPVVEGSVLTLPEIGQKLTLGYSVNYEGIPTFNFQELDIALRFNDESPDGSFYLTEPDGSTQEFIRTTSSWIQPAGVNDTISYTGSFPEPSITIRNNSTGITSTYAYDDNLADADNLVKTTDPQGDTITYNYTYAVSPDDGMAENLSSITDTQGRTVDIAYAINDYGQYPESVTDVASGRTINLGYNAENNLTTIENAASKTTTIGYTGTNYVLGSVTTPDGYETQLNLSGSFEEPGTTSIVYGYGSTAASTYTYAYPDATDTTITDPNSGVTKFTYNSSGQVTTVTDPLSHTESTSWSAANDPMTRTNGLSGITSYSYDALNNLTEITSPAGAGTAASTSYGYPTPTGALSDYLPTSSKDAQGNSTTYSYNTSYELGTTTTPGSVGGAPVNHYQGDSGISCTNAKPGELCSSVNGDGDTTSYTYDTHGNVATIVQPAPLGTISYTYDGDGRVLSKTDGRGSTLYYTYDAIDRITQVSTSSSSCTAASCTKYVYNAEGWLTQRVDASGTTNYTYDAQGHPLTMNTPTGNTTYTYDGNGNLLTYVDAGGTVGYRYDAANRLSALWEPGGSCPATPTFPNSTKCTAFGYDNANERTSEKFPNGQVTTIAYDGAGRELSVTAKTAGGTVLASRTYVYKAGTADTDLRQSVTDQAGTTTAYTYDAMNRVKSATIGSAVQSWTYDADGNRLTSVVGGTTTAAKYNAADELCYTATTNTNACGSAPSGAVVYTYNGSGDTTAATSGDITAATYSVFDQTASATSSGTTTTDTYSDITSDQRTAAGSTSYANGLLGVTRQTTSGTSVEFIRDPNGNLIAMETGGSSYYYTADALGSTILLSNSSDAAAATYTYDTWGNTTSTVTGVGATNPFRYAGGATDSDGLIKFGTRYFNPTIGRFTQVDPSGQERNAYAYANCNPVNATDSTGRDAACGKAFAAYGLNTVLTIATAAAGIFTAPTGIGAVIFGAGLIAELGLTALAYSDVISDCF